MFRELIMDTRIPPHVEGTPEGSMWNLKYTQKLYVLQVYYTSKWISNREFATGQGIVTYA